MKIFMVCIASALIFLGATQQKSQDDYRQQAIELCDNITDVDNRVLEELEDGWRCSIYPENAEPIVVFMPREQLFNMKVIPFVPAADPSDIIT
jgi:outer membrane lipoprotein-sorting protein